MFADDEWKVLRAAVDAGVGAVQLREKDLGGRALHARAAQLVSLCEQTGARILVNDRVDIACVTRAHGVHLPGAGLPIAAARGVVGAHALIGRSIHAREEIPETVGADYLIYGPIFETPSKRRYGAPQGLERLAEVSRASAVPVIAIGGITVDRVSDVLTHGARGVAVMGAILSADDPAAEVRAFRDALRTP